jgi:tetraacyldisaccharide 4'-kinase
MAGDRGPLPTALRPLAPLAERVYARIVRDRNAGFDMGRKGRPFRFSGVSVTLDRPVICVGNLSVGGTGKTPAVQLVCRWLIEAGHHPAIALRGYASMDGLSDEAELHRAALPGVPLAVGPSRVQQLLGLFATPEGESVDVVVLDDGFQHRKLARQLDIVLIDATQDPFTQRLLPAGWLREPVSSLARAHAVVLTHADRAAPADLTRIDASLRREFPHLVIAHAEHAWSALLVDGHAESLHWLKDRKYALACAIGKPHAFIAQATAAFGPPASTVILRDHDPYAPATIERLRRAAGGMDALLVTEKDWTKLSRVGSWPCPIVRPRLEMHVRAGEPDLRQLVLAAASWRDGAVEAD